MIYYENMLCFITFFFFFDMKTKENHQTQTINSVEKKYINKLYMNFVHLMFRRDYFYFKNIFI
jgi:hypothetical protein